MTEAEAKNLMIAGCQIIYDGIAYKWIRSVQLVYNRKNHTMDLWLMLEDMRANAVVVAPASKCKPIIPD